MTGSCLTMATTGARSWEAVRDVVDGFVTAVREISARSLVDAGWPPRSATLALCDGFGLSLADARAIVAQVGRDVRSAPRPDRRRRADDARPACRPRLADDPAADAEHFDDLARAAGLPPLGDAWIELRPKKAKAPSSPPSCTATSPTTAR